MTDDRFIETVQGRGGFSDRDRAVRAIEATLAALGQRLVSLAARAVADQLPVSVGGILRSQQFQGDFDLDGFYERVAGFEAASLGGAVEHAQVVCRCLGEILDGEAYEQLAKHLPPHFLALFERPDRGSSPPLRHPSSGTTLSSGRPGATHPVSEAKSAAQHNSIARSREPHQDTSLATARGTTQERTGDTLSAGRPGSRKPISEED